MNLSWGDFLGVNMTFKTSFSWWLAVSAGIMVVAPAHAQDANQQQQTSTADEAEGKMVVLPGLVIMGDKIATSAERALAAKSEAPNAITVIEGDQLNQFGDQPLGDALRRLPGVTFPGANRARDLQLRAIGAEYTQVLINGRSLIDGASRRSVQVDRIPSSLVERVEIIRSPLASQDGQGAAGTMNIVLKNTSFDESQEFGAGIGYLDKNGGLGDATLLKSGVHGPFRYSISGGVQRQRRNESKDELVFTGAGAANGGDLGTNERKYNQLNLVPSFELDVSKNDTLRFEPSYLYTKEYRDDISVELNANQVTVNRTEYEERLRTRENFGIFGSWSHDFASGIGMVVGLDAQKAREDTHRDATRYNANGTVNRTRIRTEDISLQRINPTLQMDRSLGAHDLSWGADYSNSTRDEDNTEITNGVVQTPNASRVYSVEEDRTNAFAQDIWSLGDKTTLTGGLRLEHSLTSTESGTGSSNTAAKLFALPSLHLVHRPRPDTDFRVGVARTLRRPDLRELTPTVSTAGGTLASPDTGGNPGTVPESIWGIDTGVDQYFANRGGVISVNFLARQFKDKIESVSALENGRYVSRPQNAGDGHLIGIELDGRLPLSVINVPNVTLWGNITGIRSRLDAATGETRRFLDQNDAVANAGIDWYVPKLKTTFGVASNWVSGYDQTVYSSDGSRQENEVGSSVRLDLSARTEINENMSMSLSLLNILARTEERTDKAFSAAGALTSRTETTEDTYRGVYLRMNWKF